MDPPEVASGEALSAATPRFIAFLVSLMDSVETFVGGLCVRPPAPLRNRVLPLLRDYSAGCSKPEQRK